jgi:HlyD family secretion protein
MTAGMDIKETLGITAGRGRWKRYIYALVMLVLVFGIAAFWVSRRSAVAAKSAVHYRTETARTGDLTVTVTATGQLKPTRTVDVGSQVSGIVDEVNVKYNDIVKKDEILARINTEKLDAQVQQDQAVLDSALAKVDDANVTVAQSDAQYKRDLDARQRSKKYQIVSQQGLDTDKATYDHAVVSVKTAEAAVIQARDNLKIDETNVRWAVIKSPVDGMVLSRSVEPGQTIAASFQVATLFEIAEDLRKMVLDVNVDEADVGKVRQRQHVLFTVDAYPGRQFPGTITRVQYNATTTNNVVTYLAEISVDNSELLLRPGMTATATVTVQSIKNAVLVSNHALRFLPTNNDGETGGGSFFPAPPGSNQNVKAESSAALNNPRVWVVRDGRPSPIPVEIGATDGKLTEIRSAQVTPGMPLIVEALKEGK